MTKLTLRDMRTHSKKSANTIARQCKTTPQSVYNWENGRVIPNIVIIDLLLKLYGYTYDDLDISPFYDKRDEDLKHYDE